MLQAIDLKNLDCNVFSLIGERWMLIAAGNAAGCNTMTASWGGLGVLWNKPVATSYIRPQRYTREFVEREAYFTLNFFAEEYRPQLKLCGAQSGREIDKVKACGFTVAAKSGATPYFEEAELVLVCRKLYHQDLRSDCFTDPESDEKNYPNHDYHTMYIGEIVKALQKADA